MKYNAIKSMPRIMAEGGELYYLKQDSPVPAQLVERTIRITMCRSI
jgi:hypothetical protein